MPNNKQASPDRKPHQRLEAVMVDVSSLAKDTARDIAMENLAKDRQETKGFSGLLKKIWKHNLFAEYYQQKEILKTKDKILSSGNVFINESDDKSHHNAAMSAVIERFSSEYDEALHKEIGETKLSFGANSEEQSIKQQLVDLLKEYADKDLSDQNIVGTFEAEKNRIFAQVQEKKSEVLAGGEMYADNIFEIAKQIQQAIQEGQSLEDLTANLDLTIGRAKAGVRTEAQFNIVERILNKVSENKFGKHLVSNGVLASGVAMAYCLSSKLSQPFVRSKVAQWSTFGATTIIAGGLSGLKEAKKLEEERKQYFRQMAKSKKFREQNQDSSNEFEKYRYQAVDAQKLASTLGDSLYEKDPADENLRVKELDATSLPAVLAQIADIEARISLSDRKKIDLINFSENTQVEQERWQLDVLRAKAKVDLKKYFAQTDKSDVLQQVCGDKSLPDFLESLKEAKILSLLNGSVGTENSIETKNRLWQKMKHKKVAQAAVKGALTALAFGTVVQEGMAFATDQTGLVEQLVKEHTGDSGQNATTLEGLYRWLHPKADQVIESQGLIRELIASGQVASVAEDSHHLNLDLQNIHRDMWYDNDTISSDFNELKLHGAGINQAMINDQGDFVFSVKAMTAGGSFASDHSADVPQSLTEGKIKLLFSLTKDTQNQVLEIPIGSDGLAIIPKDSEIAKLLFDAEGHFLGKYGEIVEMGAVDENNIQHVNVISTMLGKGIENLPTEPSSIAPQFKETVFTNTEVIPGQKYDQILPPPAIGFWHRLFNKPSKLAAKNKMEQVPKTPPQIPKPIENLPPVVSKIEPKEIKNEPTPSPVTEPPLPVAPAQAVPRVELPRKFEEAVRLLADHLTQQPENNRNFLEAASTNQLAIIFFKEGIIKFFSDLNNQAFLEQLLNDEVKITFDFANMHDVDAVLAIFEQAKLAELARQQEALATQTALEQKQAAQALAQSLSGVAANRATASQPSAPAPSSASQSAPASTIEQIKVAEANSEDLKNQLMSYFMKRQDFMEAFDNNQNQKHSVYMRRLVFDIANDNEMLQVFVRQSMRNITEHKQDWLLLIAEFRKKLLNDELVIDIDWNAMNIYVDQFIKKVFADNNIEIPLTVPVATAVPVVEQITPEVTAKVDALITRSLQNADNQESWAQASQAKKEIVKNILATLLADHGAEELIKNLNVVFVEGERGACGYSYPNQLSFNLEKIDNLSANEIRNKICYGLFLAMITNNDENISNIFQSEKKGEFRHFPLSSFNENFTVDQLYKTTYNLKQVFAHLNKELYQPEKTKQNKGLMPVIQKAMRFVGEYNLTFVFGMENKFDSESFEVTLDVNNNPQQLEEFLLSFAEKYTEELAKLEQLAQEHQGQEKDYKEVSRANQVEMAGDLDGSLPSLFLKLKNSDLVKVEGQNLIWQGGAGRLVFSGDICGDRSMDGFAILAKLQDLKAQAEAQGGTVEWLAGNHEQMLLDYFFFADVTNADPQYHGGRPYIGILEPGFFSPDDTFRNDLIEFKNLKSDIQARKDFFKEKIEQQYESQRQAILANMRNSQEGKEVLANLCQYKLIEKKDDILFLHTPITGKIAMILARADSLEAKITEINQVFQAGLKRFLVKGDEFSREDNSEFFFYYDTFLETENRDNFEEDILETRLRQLGVNGVVHGHNKSRDIKTVVNPSFPIILSDYENEPGVIKIKENGSIMNVNNTKLREER